MRWLGGLSEQEIAAMERRYDVHFPPDYRLFLRVLHSVDGPRMGAGYADAAMIPVPRPSFYNWQVNTRFDLPMSGFLRGDFSMSSTPTCGRIAGAQTHDHSGSEGPLERVATGYAQTDPIIEHRYLLPSHAPRAIRSYSSTNQI